jgi:hypothetical protein
MEGSFIDVSNVYEKEIAKSNNWFYVGRIDGCDCDRLAPYGDFAACLKKSSGERSANEMCFQSQANWCGRGTLHGGF